MGIKSKLLLDSRPLVIVPELACLLGVSEAIILQQMHYWLEINRKEERNIKEGFCWTYNSVAEWQKQIPFYTTKTIQRTITKLENMGILLSGNYNKANFDRTKWYRINYDVLENLMESPLGQNVLIEKDNIEESIGTKCPNQYHRLTID